VAWLVAALAIASGLAWWGAVPSGNLVDLTLRGPKGIHWNALWQTTLFILVALQVLAIALGDVVRNRSASSLLLALWLLGTLVFATWLNWSINARAILPSVPAVAILVARRWEFRWPSDLAYGRRFEWSMVPLAAGLMLALALVWADYRSANANRLAVGVLQSKYGPQGRGTELWFVGHWGFQYYLQRAGGIPLDLSGSDLNYGAVVVVPDDNPSGLAVPDDWGLVETLEEPLAPGVTLLSTDRQVAFYSSVIGPLPYYLGAVAPRNFRVYDPFAGILGSSSPAP
jgi:hypothetical protein